MTPPTKQPAIDIDAVSAGPELDALVAEHVMRHKFVSRAFGGLAVQYWLDSEGIKQTASSTPVPFSTDAYHVREVEAEIARRGLEKQYVERLVLNAIHEKDWSEEVNGADMFKIVTATPEQRCRAALRAVMETTEPLDTD